MTIEKVKHDILISGVAYVVSLLVLLLWPSRQGVDQNVVYLLGLAILTLVMAAVDWVVFDWRPSRPNFDVLAFVTQTRPRPPTDHPYGERQYTAEDIGGHRWKFSQSIADVDPASWGATSIELD